MAENRRLEGKKIGNRKGELGPQISQTRLPLQARPPAKQGEAAWGTSGQVTRISRKGAAAYAALRRAKEAGTQNQELDNRKRTMNEKLGFRFRSTWDIIEAAEKGYQLKIEE